MINKIHFEANEIKIILQQIKLPCYYHNYIETLTSNPIKSNLFNNLQHTPKQNYSSGQNCRCKLRTVADDQPSIPKMTGDNYISGDNSKIFEDLRRFHDANASFTLAQGKFTREYKV